MKTTINEMYEVENTLINHMPDDVNAHIDNYEAFRIAVNSMPDKMNESMSFDNTCSPRSHPFRV